MVEDFASKQMYIKNFVKQIKLMCDSSHVNRMQILLVIPQEARGRVDVRAIRLMCTASQEIACTSL